MQHHNNGCMLQPCAQTLCVATPAYRGGTGSRLPTHLRDRHSSSQVVGASAYLLVHQPLRSAMALLKLLMAPSLLCCLLTAPIMGAGFYQQTLQWSKGEYTSANRLEDDMAIITNLVSKVADTAGGTMLDAAPLCPSGCDAGPPVQVDGIILSGTDVDMYSFQVPAVGQMTASLAVVTPQLAVASTDILDVRRSNLWAQLRLLDGLGNVLATAKHNTWTDVTAAFSYSATATGEAPWWDAHTCAADFCMRASV